MLKQHSRTVLPIVYSSSSHLSRSFSATQQRGRRKCAIPPVTVKLRLKVDAAMLRFVVKT
ncbi:hypothetical protein C5167_019451 [Papaver somniferum]|uniref:Uncharacterized protein n=1 Tax=Papaver somniferum TaxID=3469 RepID=A0A4Y7ITG8_PAPSO|nr:hypothetical protein C5167_019451 [Papaver somniferum]